MVAAAYVHTIREVGPRPGRRLLADPGDVDGLPRLRAPASPRWSAARCCRSTTGTPTCRSPRRRSSATRPTCRSPATGGTPGYLVMWGSNVPVTRTPDAHWMTEARYRGQKVVVVAPDYADNVKFADEWLAIRPGTDGALAMSMGHVILKEFFVDRQTPYFTDYTKKYTDLPYLVALEPGRRRRPPGRQVPHRRRPPRARRRGERPLQDRAGRRARPTSWSCPTARSATGSATPASAGGTSTSATSTRGSPCSGRAPRRCLVELPRFDDVDGTPGSLTRDVPVRRVGETGWSPPSST